VQKDKGYTPLREVGVHGHLVNCAAIHPARMSGQGSGTDIPSASAEVRFTLQSGRGSIALRGPLWANSRQIDGLICGTRYRSGIV
jgi:hypothetical protein